MQKVRRTNGYRNRSLWKGLAAGLVGGLVASWTMNRFQDVWFKLVETIEKSPDNEFEDIWGDSADVLEQPTDSRAPETADDTTVRAASAISEGIFNHKLTPAEKKIAGPAVHYTLGTGVGGLYGAAAELTPQVTAGSGLPFGAAFWLVVDEGAVPLLGLSKGPTEYPVSTHVYALSSHFVYGLTAEVVRRVVRSSL